MARIWQEGFEDGFPNLTYIEGTTYKPQFLNNISTDGNILSNGRNDLSKHSLYVAGYEIGEGIYNVFQSEYTESYSRIYINSNIYGFNFKALDSDSNVLFTVTLSSLSVRVGGTLTSIGGVSLNTGVWNKIEMYFKANASSGAYELRINNVTIYSGSSLNTGTKGIKKIGVTRNSSSIFYLDDIAFNDTTGSANNSWCGNGTIVSLKPKAAGNKSQWDVSEGFAKAENGTTTTNIEITGHGLATNDVIYNKTRNEYRLVTYVDANNFTVSSVTLQAENDIILLYKNVATITATSGTSTDNVTIIGHTMQSGDVIVNTTRSDAIRKAIYIDGNKVVTYLSTFGFAYGSAVSSQASGDSIKTFAFTPYAITNHWEAVANQTDPSPKLSYIESTTSGDIDTFDMEELVADKGIPSGATVVAVSHNVYAQEAGAGSQIKPVFRISATDYEGGAITLSSGTLQYQTIYETSPATSSAWSLSEVDGLEAGVKLV